MLFKKSTEEDEGLNKIIDNVEHELEGLIASDDEFTKTADNYIKLREHRAKARPRVSKDALLTAGASIVGIVLILSYEHANVLTSKALSFVKKAG